MITETPPDKATQLAMCLQAIEDAEALVCTDHGKQKGDRFRCIQDTRRSCLGIQRSGQEIFRRIRMAEQNLGIDKEARERDIPMLPEGCGYQGYEFGASYPDSECFGGRLYDVDNCDSNGLIYQPDEDIPCPMCREKDAIAYWANRFQELPRRQAVKQAKFLVADIRNNRKNGTEPWKGLRRG